MSQSVAEPSPLLRRAALIYAFANSSFLIMLMHRVRYVIGVANYFVYVTVSYYLWDALYAANPEAVTAGWSLAQMQTYVCVNWVARSAYFSNSDNILAARINKGEITSDLLRPTSLFIQFYGSALGEVVFRTFFMSTPIFILILLFFNLQPPASPLHVFYFLYSVFLAFHLFFAVNFLTGLCAVFTEKLQGFLWAKFMLLQFLTGVLLPREFFPESVRIIFDILPFKGIAYTPTSIYIGRFSMEEMWRELFFQTVWTLILLAMCNCMWERVRRRLSVLGG